MIEIFPLEKIYNPLRNSFFLNTTSNRLEGMVIARGMLEMLCIHKVAALRDIFFVSPRNNQPDVYKTFCWSLTCIKWLHVRWHLASDQLLHSYMRLYECRLNYFQELSSFIVSVEFSKNC